MTGSIEENGVLQANYLNAVNAVDCELKDYEYLQMRYVPEGEK